MASSSTQDERAVAYRACLPPGGGTADRRLLALPSQAVADINDARRRISQLYVDLQKLVDRDPEQEVWDDVFPVMDAVLGIVRAALPNDPVIASVRDFVSADSIAAERERRAAEVLVVVGQVMAAIPDPPPVLDTVIDPPW